MACLDALLQNLTVLEFGPDAARLFARITALLQQQGRPAGDLDVLIAAIALAAGEPLITANPTHFRNIPGLSHMADRPPLRFRWDRNRYPQSRRKLPFDACQFLLDPVHTRLKGVRVGETIPEDAVQQSLIRDATLGR